MGDVLGRVFAAFFGLMVMFIVPIMLIAQKQDTVRQSYIDNAVVEFVDNAKMAGKITPEAYEKLCFDIDTAHDGLISLMMKICIRVQEVSMPSIGPFMVPHPPIMLPEVGKGEEKKIQATTDAYRQVTAKQVQGNTPMHLYYIYNYNNWDYNKYKYNMQEINYVYR